MVEITVIDPLYNSGNHTDFMELVKLGIAVSVISITSTSLLGFVISKLIRLMTGKV